MNITIPYLINVAAEAATVNLPGQVLSGNLSATVADPPSFAWSMVYRDGVGNPNFSRIYAPGQDQALVIAPGVYPPGYMISDGTTVGGVIPSGTQNGTLPIRIQPPTSGIGPMKFVVTAKITVSNLNTTRATGAYAVGLGVANPSQTNQPMTPWLGVGHDLDPKAQTVVNIAADAIQNEIFFRMDIVDNAFATVPNWPNWQTVPDPTTLLYPAITPVFFNAGTTTLQVSNVFITGHAL